MIVEVTDFQKDVVERSFTAPVVVDFWAEWCGPCRMLGPVLERLAEEARGEWVLAKVDTEALPQVAADFGIRGIPAVKLFVDGRPSAEFTGALPEPSVRQWLSTNLPDKHRADLDQAEALLASGNEKAAIAISNQVLADDATNVNARILKAKALLFADPEAATKSVEGIEEHVEGFEQVDSIRTLARILGLAKTPDLLPEGPVKERYSSALADASRRDFDSALTAFIDVIRQDRHYDDDGSRKACIAIFKYLGEGNETTLKHRRDFSSALY
jgi:putative thioredoxin